MMLCHAMDCVSYRRQRKQQEDTSFAFEKGSEEAGSNVVERERDRAWQWSLHYIREETNVPWELNWGVRGKSRGKRKRCLHFAFE